MASQGPRKGKKRPRKEEKESSDPLKDLTPWQVAALPAHKRKGLRRGAFDKDEDIMLTESFTLECESRGLTDDEKAHIIQDTVFLKGANMKRFWVDVASRLPKRSIRSIRARAQRLLHPHSYKGAFTDEDIATMKALVAKHGEQWKLVGEALKRHPLVVREAYRYNADGILHGPWTSKEEEALLAIMHQEGHIDQPGAAKIYWPSISKAVGSRSEGQCMHKWYSVFGRKERGHVWTPVADASLVVGVQEEGEELWDHVEWQELAETLASTVGGTGLTAADCRRRFRALCLRARAAVGKNVSDAADRVQAYLEGVYEGGNVFATARAGMGKEDYDAGTGSDTGSSAGSDTGSSSGSDTDSSSGSDTDSDDDEAAPAAPAKTAVASAGGGSAVSRGGGHSSDDTSGTSSSSSSDDDDDSDEDDLTAQERAVLAGARKRPRKSPAQAAPRTGGKGTIFDDSSDDE